MCENKPVPPEYLFIRKNGKIWVNPDVKPVIYDWTKLGVKPHYDDQLCYGMLIFGNDSVLVELVRNRLHLMHVTGCMQPEDIFNATRMYPTVGVYLLMAEWTLNFQADWFCRLGDSVVFKTGQSVININNYMGIMATPPTLTVIED